MVWQVLGDTPRKHLPAWTRIVNRSILGTFVRNREWREQRKFFTHRRIDFLKFSLPAIKYYTIDKRKELAI